MLVMNESTLNAMRVLVDSYICINGKVVVCINNAAEYEGLNRKAGVIFKEYSEDDYNATLSINCTHISGIIKSSIFGFKDCMFDTKQFFYKVLGCETKEPQTDGFLEALITKAPNVELKISSEVASFTIHNVNPEFVKYYLSNASLNEALNDHTTLIADGGGDTITVKVVLHERASLLSLVEWVFVRTDIDGDVPITYFTKDVVGYVF